MTVWVFPGQGSQRPGMAAGLGAVPALLREAAEILGDDEAADFLTGPDMAEDPGLIQPALFVVGVAAATALLRHEPSPKAVIGHSFGEYAALTASGALSFEAGLRLVVRRAHAMARCADDATGMLAVLGLGHQQVRRICSEAAADGEDVGISHINSPSQTVISGRRQAIDAVARICRDRGAYRTRRLRVPYGAHTPLMAPAAAEMRAALAATDLEAPAATVYSPVTGEATADPDRIRDLLVLGMTRPVDFCSAVRAAAGDGHRHFTELGPGSPARLLGLIREILSDHGPALRLRLVSSDVEARTPQPFRASAAPPTGRRAVDRA